MLKLQELLLRLRVRERAAAVRPMRLAARIRRVPQKPARQRPVVPMPHPRERRRVLRLPRRPRERRVPERPRREQRWRRRPRTLALLGRDESRLAPLVEQIKAIDGSITVVLIPLELGSLASVRGAAAAALAAHPRRGKRQRRQMQLHMM